MRNKISALGVRSETNTLGVKIIIFILGGLVFLSGFQIGFAIGDPNSFSSEEAADTAARMDAGNTTTATSGDNSVGNEAEGGEGGGGGTEVTVTEQIPGMDCTQEKGGGPESKKYKCTIQSGFGSVMAILSGLIKYATFITALVGVLMLVVSGVQYSMAGAEKSAAEDAKKRIQKTILGLVLLFLVGFILNTVAPWVYR